MSAPLMRVRVMPPNKASRQPMLTTEIDDMGLGAGRKRIDLAVEMIERVRHAIGDAIGHVRRVARGVADGQACVMEGQMRSEKFGQNESGREGGAVRIGAARRHQDGLDHVGLSRRVRLDHGAPFAVAR